MWQIKGHYNMNAQGIVTKYWDLHVSILGLDTSAWSYVVKEGPAKFAQVL